MTEFLDAFIPACIGAFVAQLVVQVTLYVRSKR